jgi:hypothetical protein
MYRINERDEIISVNDDWCKYASDHGWDGISSDEVLHRPIYTYIKDSTTSRLYQYLFKRVRGGSTVRYQFNCVSKSHRRVMEMTVKPIGNGECLELKARMLHKQAHLQSFDKLDGPHEDKFLRTCGWCRRIDLEGNWIEVEDAVAKLEVFEFCRLPKLTHGICNDCFAEMLSDARSIQVLNRPSIS